MFEESDLVFSYTRAQAIADGVLIDVSARAREAGFLYPVALTDTVWASCVEWPADDHRQDQSGRLWDVLSLARLAVNRAIAEKTDTIYFELSRLPPKGYGRQKIVTLTMRVHGGDNAEPVITIMGEGDS